MAELIRQEGNQVEFKVTVPATDVTRAYQQVWAALARDVRVPGFRPGKAPKKVLESRVGTGYVENEVRDRLLQVHYPQAVRDLKLSMVDAEINPDPLKDGQSFEFTVKGDTYPEVKLGDWKSATLQASAPDITDDVLERTLADLQERNATFETAERAIEATDMVTIEEQGEEGGTYPVYLDVAEAHVRDALVGKNQGDTVEITVPAHSHGDHEHPEHTVTVKILDVKHKQLQALDDEFAKSLNFESLERLRTDLKAELERRARQEGDNARREEFVNHLVEGMTVDIPSVMLERRREAMLGEIKDDLSRQGVKWDEYETFMKEQGKLDDFMADLGKNAETRVKRDLALEQLAEDTGTTLSDTEFNAQLSALAQANGITVQQLRSQFGPNGLNSYYASIVREKALQGAIASLGSSAASSEGESADAGEEQPAQTEEAQAE
ncbi:trigger factor [Deinococcus maricopensis]|uniref:Trigger factor n=1 Tax=Deinococcus maricopensis (strain DSM 21211 / LMG 22137 / NRRL B-23946 / LB-34) TaxID=709986 RepID=E8U4I0_DEIML|nr:trigger factor [Deinococcus maricopensis]ADV68845.1 Trigger factor [Deinococcus maricopensis DSM 21211]